jgi:hypothetical protein
MRQHKNLGLSAAVLPLLLATLVAVGCGNSDDATGSGGGGAGQPVNLGAAANFGGSVTLLANTITP